MKRKTLTLAISVFALLAIISVGFASWVITRPLEAEPVAGSIQVDEVTDLKISIETKWVDEKGADATPDPVIKFGNKSGAQPTDWLYNNSLGEQNLKAYLQVTVKFSDKEVLKGKKIVAHFEAVAASGSDVQTYKDAISQGYIKGTNHDSDIEGFEITYDDLSTVTDGVYTETLTISFDWGVAKFGGVHPTKKWTSVSDADAAKTTLNELYNKLKGISYKVSFVQRDVTQ